MKFVKNTLKAKERPNVVDNFVHILKSFKVLRKKMKEHGFLSFSDRLFNQDPIENFFGQIRQHGARNTKPTTAAFKDYFKSSPVNSVVQNNVRGTNCEDSLSSGFLVNIQTLMNHVPRNLTSPKVWDLPALPNDFDSQKPFTYFTTEFINDIFQKKMLNESYIDCSTCTKNLLLGCERRDCEPFCRVSNLDHSVMNIANVSLHYFPIVSHYDNFTTKIKTYLM